MACDDEADDALPCASAMARELQQLTTAAGAPDPSCCVAALAEASVYAADGHRLPATYANYLVVNGVVLAPSIW